ncbi:MAG: type III-A CRISPR-associated protein Csm2, partial [Deltaproteobacteria bacterium RBG_16_47_11]
EFGNVDVKEFAKEEGWANDFAKSLGEKMKTTQLRKVFTSIKLMEQGVKGKVGSDPFDNPELYMLLPQMAYAKARKLIIPEFYDLAKTIINDGMIKNVGDFRRFAQFMTAIVAYHKQYGK